MPPPSVRRIRVPRRRAVRRIRGSPIRRATRRSRRFRGRAASLPRPRVRPTRTAPLQSRRCRWGCRLCLRHPWSVRRHCQESGWHPRRSPWRLRWKHLQLQRSQATRGRASRGRVAAILRRCTAASLSCELHLGARIRITRASECAITNTNRRNDVDSGRVLHTPRTRHSVSGYTVEWFRWCGASGAAMRWLQRWWLQRCGLRSNDGTRSKPSCGFSGRTAATAGARTRAPGRLSNEAAADARRKGLALLRNFAEVSSGFRPGAQPKR
jgi:hypothetical protein